MQCYQGVRRSRKYNKNETEIFVGVRFQSNVAATALSDARRRKVFIKSDTPENKNTI